MGMIAYRAQNCSSDHTLPPMDADSTASLALGSGLMEVSKCAALYEFHPV